VLSQASRSIRSGLPPAQNEARISTVKSAYLRRSRSNPWRTYPKTDRTHLKRARSPVLGSYWAAMVLMNPRWMRLLAPALLVC